MLRRYTAVLVAVLAIGLAPHTPALAQQGPSPEIRALIDGLMDTLRSSDDEALGLFIAQRVDPAYVAQVGNESLESMLREMRAAAAGAGGLDVGRTGEGLRIMLEGGASRAVITMAIPFSSPNLITELGLEVDNGPSASGGATPEPTSLQEALNLRTQAVESLWGTDHEERQLAFERYHMAPGVSAEDLAETFQQIRAIGGQAGGLMVEFDGTVSTLKLRGPRNADVSIYVQDRPPFRIINLELMEVEREELPEPPVFSWDDLGAQLETTVADGFSGTVLAARDGEIVLHQAFGGADGAGRPFSLDTAFDIGSIPIDFTHGAVRLLVQRGQLDLDAPITEYLSDVPGDKAQITIGHLIRSESGLSNFHGQPGDADMDLAPIGREEAIRRIMSQPLLFEPGRGNAHSHSAWTLLAALTEIVSGQSYMGFLQTNFFEPAGMTRTGLYGPDARFEEADQAIGFGYSKPATPNVPLNWGPTSWLVMGSGGMVSTPMDLYRWHRFIRGTAGPLTATTRASLSSAGMSLGTTDRGFMTMSAFDGDTIIIACTNRFESRANPAHQVVRGLGRLVAEGS